MTETLHAKLMESMVKLGERKENERILEIMKQLKNPYPQDVFKWDNKENIEFNRGGIVAN